MEAKNVGFILHIFTHLIQVNVSLLAHHKECNAMIGLDVLEVCDIWSDKFEHEHIIVTFVNIGFLVALEGVFFFSNVVHLRQDLIEICRIFHLFSYILELYSIWSVLVGIFEPSVSVKVCIAIKANFGLHCAIDQSCFLFAHNKRVIVDFLPAYSFFWIDCQTAV